MVPLIVYISMGKTHNVLQKKTKSKSKKASKRGKERKKEDANSEENEEDQENKENNMTSSDDGVHSKSSAWGKEHSDDDNDDDDTDDAEKENKSDEEDSDFDFSTISEDEESSWISSDDDEILKCRDGDIQDHKNLKDKIYECDTFAGIDIKEAYEGDQIKEGQRVVLSSEYEQRNRDDKGIGFVGTIIKVEEDTVRVLWDSEKIHKTYNTSGDLLLLDNAQTGAIHNGYKCSECKENPIRGMKWSCCLCKDIHLCTQCYMRGEHILCHEFERKLYQKSRRKFLSCEAIILK
ncbi:uncharacterized protein LOC133198261 [Saccostrea echinata]|uniref:uncharacterized protein LOC133198261 n=1 Tax=Saccostrea echinata TaxID=191078 RepID=UPI002A7F69CA|nr:uncharacterized protein LOC133198261 [Saccostrea echinata]